MAGGGVRAAQLIVVLLGTASIGILSHVVGRSIDPRHALPTAVLFAWWLWTGHNFTLLWNPSIVPFPVVLGFISLILAAHSGKAVASAFAGFWIAVASMSHVVCLILFLPLLAISTLVSRSALAGLIAGCAGFLVTLLAFALAMCRNNFDVAVRNGWTTPAALIVAAVIVIAVLFRRHWFRIANLNRKAPSAVVAIVWVCPVIIGNLGFWATTDHGVVSRYWEPAAPALALIASFLAVLIGETLIRRVAGNLQRTTVTGHLLPSAIALCLLASVWSGSRHLRNAERNQTDAGSFDDIAAISHQLSLSGLSWNSIASSWEGPSCWERVSAIGTFMPQGRPNAGAPRVALRVLIVDKASARELAGNGVDLAALGHSTIAAVSIINTWLDKDEAGVCRIDAHDVRQCAHVHPVSTTPQSDVFMFSSRAHPRVHDLPNGDHYVSEYAIPVRHGNNESDRLITILDEAGARCPWRIVSIAGAEFQGTLPNVSVRMLGKAASATLVVSKRFDPVACGEAIDRNYPPCVLETLPEEREWRHLAQSTQNGN